jgi:hypothetical protein
MLKLNFVSLQVEKIINETGEEVPVRRELSRSEAKKKSMVSRSLGRVNVFSSLFMMYYFVLYFSGMYFGCHGRFRGYRCCWTYLCSRCIGNQVEAGLFEFDGRKIISYSVTKSSEFTSKKSYNVPSSLLFAASRRWIMIHQVMLESKRLLMIVLESALWI